METAAATQEKKGETASPRRKMSLTSVLSFLTDPRYRRRHGIIITAALTLHLASHYATFMPALRDALGNLPYFKLHVLHEAEFLLIIAYSGIVFGFKGGLAALAITGLTSMPFVFTPFFFGRDPAQTKFAILPFKCPSSCSWVFLSQSSMRPSRGDATPRAWQRRSWKQIG